MSRDVSKVMRHGQDFSLVDTAGNAVQPLNVATVGDSITYGRSSSDPGFTTSYPYVLGGLKSLVYGSSIFNFGVPGAQIKYQATDTDFLLKANHRNWLVVMFGINDINNGRTAAQIVADLQTYVTARQASGWGVTVCTITGVPIFSSGQNAVRSSLNTLIRSTFTNVCNVAADAKIGDTPDVSFYNIDGVHLTDAGYARLASVVNGSVLPVFPSATVQTSFGPTRDSHLKMWARDMMLAYDPGSQVTPWYNMVLPSTGAYLESTGTLETSGTTTPPFYESSGIGSRSDIRFPGVDAFERFSTIGSVWSTYLGSSPSSFAINVVVRVNSIAGTSNVTPRFNDAIFGCLGGIGLYLKQPNIITAEIFSAIGSDTDLSSTISLSVDTLVTVRFTANKLGIRVTTAGSWLETTKLDAFSLTGSVIIAGNQISTNPLDGRIADFSIRDNWDATVQSNDDAYYRARYGVM